MKNWLNAFRLKTLPLSLASILMGTFIAKYEGSFSWLIFSFAALTTIFLQILSNLANDYGDFEKGADNEERIGPERALQSGAITKSAMKNAIIIFSLLSFVTGLSMLFIAFTFDQLKLISLFLVLGIGAIWAAINYTAGKNAYGYRAMGDLFVFIFFGLVGVCGTYFLFTKSFEWHILLPATTSGLLATGVLNINNIRDIESDKNVGKTTIPVLLGEKKAKLYHWFLLLGAFVCIMIWVYFFTEISKEIYLISGFLPAFVLLADVVSKNKVKEKLNNQLRNLSLFSLIFTLIFGFWLNR